MIRDTFRTTHAANNTRMNDRSRPGPLLIALAYVGFVSLGLPDAVIGVAWPSVRNAFSLPQSAAGIASGRSLY